MALIGEQFDEAEEICGVVVSVRQRQDKLALWTKNAANEAVQVLLWTKYYINIFRSWMLQICDLFLFAFLNSRHIINSIKICI